MTASPPSVVPRPDGVATEMSAFRVPVRLGALRELVGAGGSRSTAPASASVGRRSRLYVSAELLGLTGSNPLRG
jgi:hypothetical protein